MMMVAKRDASRDDEPETLTQTPLERYLGRVRDARTGKLVPKKRRARATAASVFDRTKVEVREMIESGEWAGCEPRHLVALYVEMHSKTYGFEPTMSGKELHKFGVVAGSFVKRVFNGDMDKTLDFVQWIWTREMGREKWRRENHRDGGRLGFCATMSNRAHDDYRAFLARRK